MIPFSEPFCSEQDTPGFRACPAHLTIPMWAPCPPPILQSYLKYCCLPPGGLFHLPRLRFSPPPQYLAVSFRGRSFADALCSVLSSLRSHRLSTVTAKPTRRSRALGAQTTSERHLQVWGAQKDMSPAENSVQQRRPTAWPSPPAGVGRTTGPRSYVTLSPREVLHVVFK